MQKLAMMTAAGLLLSTALASAQTAEAPPADTSGTIADATSTNTTSTDEGAFARLSPGNQKIARSLFEAQKAPAETATGGTTAGGTADGTVAAETGSHWTLDQIAAAKQSGQGWGNVFKEMKAQGLVEAKNLGQVVSGKAFPPSPPPPPPPSGDTSGTGETASNTTSSGTGSTTGDHTASGDAATAASSSVATRPSGGRHFGSRDSEVIVTLGNNRDITASSGPRSSFRQGASGHGGGRFDSGVGARGIGAGGQNSVIIAGGHGSSVGAVRGGGGQGQGRGGGNGGSRGH